MKHTGTVQLETERIILRRFKASDAVDMYQNWANDPEVTKYLTWPTHEDVEITQRVVNSWVENYEKEDNYMWAIVPKDYGKVIGSISTGVSSEQHDHCEIGYCMSKSYWGKGIMAEILREVLRYLLEVVEYQRVGAIHYTKNAASGRVMKKAGMTHEGCKRNYHKDRQGGYYNCQVYSMISDDLKKLS